MQRGDQNAVRREAAGYGWVFLICELYGREVGALAAQYSENTYSVGREGQEMRSSCGEFEVYDLCEVVGGFVSRNLRMYMCARVCVCMFMCMCVCV
jgi:hypothetical protein